jgi:RNA polymerase-binding transcription factor
MEVGMRHQALEAARQRLERRRAELIALIRGGDAGIAQIRSEREIEFGDEAQSEEEQERIARVGEVEAIELARVDAALARVAAGTYGTCGTCGEDIDPRRLDASPWAVQCAECAGATPRQR